MHENRTSEDIDLNALRAEVARLAAGQERLAAAQRRLRAALAGTLALAAGAAGILFAQPAQSALSLHEVRAPFRVVSRGGKVLFRVTQQGVIDLNDDTGAPIAQLVSAPQGRGLVSFDDQGGVIGFLGTSPSPNGLFRGLVTLDPNGAPTTTLGQTPLPGVTDRGLFFYRQDGTIGGGLAHNPVLQGDGLVIADAAGENSVITLGVQLPANRVGLEISNLALQQMVRLGATPETGLFQLLDSNGNIFFSQPPVP